ncbi:MAG: hypothetical protein ACK48K_07710 [Planctomycetota bacterium]
MDQSTQKLWIKSGSARAVQWKALRVRLHKFGPTGEKPGGDLQSLTHSNSQRTQQTYQLTIGIIC